MHDFTLIDFLVIWCRALSNPQFLVSCRLQTPRNWFMTPESTHPIPTGIFYYYNAQFGLYNAMSRCYLSRGHALYNAMSMSRGTRFVQWDVHVPWHARLGLRQWKESQGGWLIARLLGLPDSIDMILMALSLLQSLPLNSVPRDIADISLYTVLVTMSICSAKRRESDRGRHPILM